MSLDRPTPHASEASDSGDDATSAELILNAARDLILAVGFRRSTVADVARRAGVSRMTVYRVFPDLSAIWSRLLTDELLDLVGQARDQLAQAPNARTRLIAMAELLVREIPEHALFERALDLDPEVLMPLVVTRFGSSQRAVLAEVEQLLLAGQADGSVRAELDPKAAAGGVLLVAQSFIFSARAIGTQPAAQAIRAELPQILHRYLAP